MTKADRTTLMRRAAQIWLTAALALLVATAGAKAAVITVDTLTDQAGAAAGCSLRQAVEAADTDSSVGDCAAGAGADTIRLPGGVHRLSIPGSGENFNQTGDLDFRTGGAATIEPAGAGRVAIEVENVGNQDRAIENSGGGSLAIRNLTVRGGRLGPIADGGGILNSSGSLTLEGVTVTDSSAQAGDGGAIANYDTAVLVNSTLAGNSAQRNGGGFYGAGGSSAQLRNVTVSRNAADAFGTNSGDGGGIAAVLGGTINSFNTIIAGNFDNSPGAGTVVPDCATSTDFYPRYTLIGERTPVHCLVGFDPGTNVTGDPGLEALADNGGPTATMLPDEGSQVVDGGGSVAPDLCRPDDQRGVSRPQGSACDLGAVERRVEENGDGGGSGGAGNPGAMPAGKAHLRLAGPRPKLRRARRGARVVHRVAVRNRGDLVARRTRVCLVLKGRKARRSLGPVGRRCRILGALRPGQVKRLRMVVRVRGRAPAGRVALRYRAVARGTRGDQGRALIQVR